MFILRFILKIILKIAQWLAKIAVFIIIKLFLWIPMIFAAIFALASAVVPFPFMQYFNYFWIIIGCGTVLALLLSFYRYFIYPVKKRERAKSKKDLSQNDKEIDKDKPNSKKAKVTETANYQKEIPNQLQIQENEVYDKRVFEAYVGPDEIQAKKPKRNAPWFNSIYEVKTEPDNIANIPDLKSYQNFDTQHIIQDGENVNLYRTRKDPSLYIAEYSDRIEYYRKNGEKMVLVSVEENTLKSRKQ